MLIAPFACALVSAAVIELAGTFSDRTAFGANLAKVTAPTES